MRAVLFLTVLVAGLRSRAEGVHPREAPCPNAADIYPCFCTVLPDYQMNMDCSNVTSSQQLADVFTADFPFTEFFQLYITDNPYLDTILAGDLGTASFKEVYITNGVLTTVGLAAFANSYSTLTLLKMRDNLISSFPFAELDSYTSLQVLDLRLNDLTAFVLSSSSLQEALLGNNPFGAVDATNFQYLPELRVLSLHLTNMQTIPTGTFINMPQLWSLSLDANDIASLPLNAINFQVPGGDLFLNYNSITSMEVNAIVGQGGHVHIDNNDFEVLDELVFRPLMDASFLIFVDNNPLLCGCEIAWLRLNATYMSMLEPDATCADGQLVVDLDPAMFENLC